MSELQPADYLKPVSLAIRDRIVDRMLETVSRYRHKDSKRLYYISMEWLMGRLLGNNLSNLRLEELCREVMASFGVSLDDVMESEIDAGLGNGGLGRLAACFQESLATLGMPGFGYGIDYEFGLFKQEIVNGFQREKPDRWKANGTPFQIEHPEKAVSIPMYGRVETHHDADGNPVHTWVNPKIILGMPTDMPVVGYLGQTVNWLRLFTARASEDFDIEIFNRGDYIRAVEQKLASENITRVLYPSDSVMSGKELRLVQEYFLVACSIGDLMRRFTQQHGNIDLLPSKVAIQMNDTHPSLAVAELMRVLTDLHGADEVRRGFRSLKEIFGDRLAGVIVQPVITGGVEVRISVLHEQVAGPLVLFGLGGGDGDVLADRAARLAPLTDTDADDLIRSARAAPRLLGRRGAPAADLASLRDMLLRVSRMADDLPQIAELELSPVIARPDGVQAVDGRIRIQAAEPADAHLRRLP